MAQQTRRDFVRTVAAGAGALLAGECEAPAARLANPNILIIMVDQMRTPVWLTAAQRSVVNSVVTPNIAGRIQAKAVSFTNYFVAAASCTPARSTILTGLYTPQTAIYETAPKAPGLSAAFPTWGSALPVLNAAYKNNVWWFGKWHLSPYTGMADPLLQYGFRTSLYPSAQYRSPDGAINEGSTGGYYPPDSSPQTYLANDADITTDFVNWMQRPKTGPWCATVSLVNPHDIFDFPASFPPSPYPPPVLPICSQVLFPPPPGPPSDYVYSSIPSTWNYETPDALAAKQIWLQTNFQQSWNGQSGEVTDWVSFLNWYYWLQHQVDQQVGRILDALASSADAANTVVVFTSDHGEYAGSHGLHNKSGAAYDEGIHVPLYVSFPGGTSSTRSQLCSSVDFFGLICDLATSGGRKWATQYPDLAQRESMYGFLYKPSMPEQFRISPGLGVPYVLHTTDEMVDTSPDTAIRNHVVCLRTRSQPGDSSHGAKYALYNQWLIGGLTPDPSVEPDVEFYNYATNPGEMGNQALNPTPHNAALISRYQEALGSYGASGTGAIAAELTLALTGTGTDGKPLRNTLSRAQQMYLAYAATGGCSA